MNRDEALQGLVDKGVLTADQLAAVRDVLRDEAPGAPKWLAEAAGYVGGVLMLGGAGILMATQWDTMSRTARSASLGGITLVLLLAAVLLAMGKSAVRRRIAGVLVAIASGTAALTAGVLAEHWEATAAGLTGLTVATIGYAFLRAIPPLLAMGANTVVVAAAVPGDAWNGGELGVTLAFLAAGLLWFGLAFAGVLTPVPVAFGIGGTIAIAGGQLGLTVTDAPWWGYASTFAVALLCFAVYGVRRTPILLVGGVVAIALAAPEAVWSWTDGAAGGAVILLVAGAALIGASALGLRLARLGKTSAA